MAQDTSIEWATKTWGPTKGCTLESPGCKYCYAMALAHRFDHPGGWAEGLTRTINRINTRDHTVKLPTWSGVVEPQLHKLDEPLRWRSGPHLVFVNSMSDLFHPKLPWEYVLAVLGVIMACPGHTFQVLTKRPAYMAKLLRDNAATSELSAARNLRYHAQTYIDLALNAKGASARERKRLQRKVFGAMSTMEDLETGRFVPRWPLPNLWLGTSVEDVERKGRIDDLRDAPAALRFVSFEPLLEDLGELDLSGIDWVIIGGESGPSARPCYFRWMQRIVEQARAQGAKVFVKQMGSVWARQNGSETSKGQDMGEWPEELAVREFPKSPQHRYV